MLIVPLYLAYNTGADIMRTESDYESDNSLDCPHCNVPIEEQDLQWVEPDIGDQKMECPHCSKKLAVRLEIIHLYKARLI